MLAAAKIVWELSKITRGKLNYTRIFLILIHIFIVTRKEKRKKWQSIDSPLHLENYRLALEEGRVVLELLLSLELLLELLELDGAGRLPTMLDQAL